MSNVRRVYVEKKPAFAVQAKELKHEVSSYLGIKSVTAVRVLIRYDVENISDEVFDKACKTVFAEPPVDDLYLEKFESAEDSHIFSVEFLPGQFDQRADSAVQCASSFAFSSSQRLLASTYSLFAINLFGFLIYYDFCAKLQKSIVSAKEKGELFFFYQRKAVPLHPNHQKYDMPQTLHIAIIGGGAAGFFAAIEAKRNFPHADITIFEKNSKVLAKVEITGGCVSVTGIKDQFALEGETLTREYASIALGAAFHPYFVGGTFDPEAVGIEKQMLKKALEDEINDKRLYCLHQANREFFGDSPAGVRQEGYLEEVDGLTPAMLTAAYRQMLRTANIELLVLGCDAAQTAAIRDALLAELACIDRAPLPLVENMAMPAIAPVHKTENYDMVQAKLCMLFTLGQPMQPQQLAAVRLAMALYGGSVTSRLFLNVRERDHLCYYCSSSFQSFTGSMAVNSGVEHADAARAEQAILKELADLCTGPITDEEFEDCRRGLLSGMNGVEDSLGGIESWYYIEVLRAGANSAAPIQSPEQARNALRTVTKDEVRDILRRLTLSVSYLLTKEDAAHAAE